MNDEMNTKLYGSCTTLLNTNSAHSPKATAYVKVRIYLPICSTIC